MDGEVSPVAREKPIPFNVTWLKLYKELPLLIAFATGWAIWNLPPAALSEQGMHFAATLVVAVILWAFEVYDEYIVALMLLLSWVLFRIVPSKIALAGFSESSWFFAVGALGMGAAVAKTGLFYRLVLQVLRRIPLAYFKTYTFFLLASGILTSPLLPTPKGRVAIMGPVSQAISDAAGFKPRSNGSAALGLSTFIGFGQMSFLFLTGGDFCILGWNLLPAHAKSEFGWLTWAMAALPAGLIIFLFLFAAINFLFPLRKQERLEITSTALEQKSAELGPLTRDEWIGISALALALAGWMSQPLHRIDEAWIAVIALLIFLVTGVLDKTSLKNNIDWGFLIFFGIVNSTAAISTHLKVDRWLTGLMVPILSSFAAHPTAFLLVVVLLVYFVRIFLRKTAATMVLTLTLLPWAGQVGIHPGVLLLTVLIAAECFFLTYQDGSYQIAYYNTDGKAFSHVQARKVMTAKMLASLLAVSVSVPYWRFLGLIH